MIQESDRILLVDDDTSSLDVLYEVLTRANYDVVLAENGYEALKLAQGHLIDLAILDFNLPDTTGAELLQRIRRLQPRAPIIIMSANTSQNVKFAVFEAGAYTFIPKPMDLSQLLRFVERALNLRHEWGRDYRENQTSVTSVRSNDTVEVKRSIFFRWTRIIKIKHK